MAANGNARVPTTPGAGGVGRNGLAKIQTNKKAEGVCHDDSTPPVKAQTIDELHSLQMKKSAPTTPIDGMKGPFAAFSEDERSKQQLQSISASLASLTRETGPKVVKGDPARQSETPVYRTGSPNIEMDEHTFMVNRERAVDYLNSLDKVFVNDQFLNWDPENRIKVRIVSARAYHSLFMHNMCIRPTPEELENFGTPDFTIYNAGQFPCNRYTHYMTSSTSIDLNLARREMVILGTQYAGEMKKAFSVLCTISCLSVKSCPSILAAIGAKMEMLLSSLACQVRYGKTTLSTDHNRYLIGDDEHCWGDNGVSNIEGGCYAKCIDLSREKEPDIWNAIKFGTVLENVVFDEHTREVDYSDKSVTENTRAAYPIEYIPNAKIPCVAPHPKNVILLACDAFGVLPPVSKLSLAQTMYHFISGYTALVAGTEDGIKEPQATFSACFGAAFIMMHPTKYAAMLAAKMEKHGATGWLVNTGWSGGRYGSGNRIKLAYTRKIIDAIHSGSLLKANYKKTEVFGDPNRG
ncbi:UNVERIFIED_CONTAM: Phosphoenolpyruvate carboxykinase (ATP) [Sesamum angustifolium]|uniref:phosphoenolpyruvate carboxykinase (ATP) n=1 Tax=Sesamum angustifolium TaxID=2727405 RepID=A0AAW2RNG3_9LAMI